VLPQPATETAARASEPWCVIRDSSLERFVAPYARGRYARSPPHGPRTTAHGPLLQRRETRLTDGFPVTRLVLFEQSVAYQKPDAAAAQIAEAQALATE